jgi:NTP pyrophosphatase (non-canonical NTP hydrolase)
MNIKEIATEIHSVNVEKGFWPEDKKSRNVGELLMLVTSELGEALEAHRKSAFADVEKYKAALEAVDGSIMPAAHFKTHMKDTFEDEIADAVIRLLDLAEGLEIDLEFHIRHKVDFNKTREKLHGKNY